MHQNLAVKLRQFNYSKNSFIAMIPGRPDEPGGPDGLEETTLTVVAELTTPVIKESDPLLPVSLPLPLKLTEMQTKHPSPPPAPTVDNLALTVLAPTVDNLALTVLAPAELVVKTGAPLGQSPKQKESDQGPILQNFFAITGSIVNCRKILICALNQSERLPNHTLISQGI